MRESRPPEGRRRGGERTAEEGGPGWEDLRTFRHGATRGGA